MGQFATRIVTDPDERGQARVKVAWLHPVVAHYRVPVVNRLFKSTAVDLTVYGGQALEGVGVADASQDLDGPVVNLRNIHLARPGLDPRVLYVCGWTRIVARRPEVIITSEASHNIVNWALLAARKAFGHRVIIMGHIKSSGQGRMAMSLRQHLVKRADGVLAYTLEGVEQAAAWGVPRDRVASLGNTLDLSRIEAARRSVQRPRLTELHRSLGLSGLVCLFLGRPNRVKRLDLAIDAIRLMTKRGIAAHLIVVGSSKELPAYVERAEGMENVHFIGEVLDEHVLAPYFSLTDIALIPGAVGLSVNHAFAYGVPLVTSADAPHRPEMTIAEHGKNALLVTPMEAPALADALEGLVRNPDALEDLKAGALATVVPGADDMVAAIESLVVSVARRARRDVQEVNV